MYLRMLLDREAFPEFEGGQLKEPARCSYCRKTHSVRPLYFVTAPMRPEWVTCLNCHRDWRLLPMKGLCSEFREVKRAS